ncbi:MAG: gamma-glutamylcyclotransferase family protein [Acidobacteriota bacterium]
MVFGLARISQRFAAAGAAKGALAALRLLGLLDVLSNTPAEPSQRAPCARTLSHALATQPVEKCGLAQRAVATLLVIVLPAPERDRIARQYGINAARWSFAFGIVEGLVGMGLYLIVGLAYLTGATGRLTEALLAMDPFASRGSITLGGIMGWFGWHMQPICWLFIMAAVTGFVRTVSFLLVQQPVAEPVVWAGVRLYGAARRARRRSVRQRQLGPDRPDRIFVEGDHLVILSAREKPGWEEDSTIQIEDRFFRLTGTDERPDGRWRAIVYTLEELEESELPRGPLQADVQLPADLPGGPVTAEPGRRRLFFYGPEMAEERALAAAPSVRRVTPACAKGYLLRFYRRGADGTGKATLISTSVPGDTVWGVLYDCAEQEVAELERRLGLEDGCRIEKMEVEGTDGNSHLAVVYVALPEAFDRSLRPTPAYRDELVAATCAFGFPAVYVRLLASTPSTGADG